jgi:hypothetical protein
MAENILYFDEYLGSDEYGNIVHPYLDSKGCWCMNGRHLTIQQIGNLCNIPEDELIILKLKYGSESIHRGV